MSELNEYKTHFLTCRSNGRDWKCIFVVCGYTYNHSRVFQYSSLHCVEIIYIFILVYILSIEVWC
jgi:hypothetical protein